MAFPWFADRPPGVALVGLAVALTACSSDSPPSSSGADASATADAASGGTSGDDARSPADSGVGGAGGGDAAPSSGVTPAPEGEPYETLAEWHLFKDAPKQEPNEGVIPYVPIVKLFSDYAAKHRFIYVPEGKQIGYEPTDKWRFPVGTILVKTFSYLTDARDPSLGERLLETRLLIHESGGWKPHTYVWNAEQTAATMEVAGDVLLADFVDPSGQQRHNDYRVPDENDCRNCHGKSDATNTLGGRTRQLDRDNDYGNGPENQIDHFAALGLFEGPVEPAAERQRLVDPFGGAPIFERVRSYLDVNCGHCHQPGDSPGSLSGFWLDYASTDPATNPDVNWGICKEPTSAGGATCGRQLDVVPGSPDDSILVCRIESEEAKVRMPPVGRNLVHEEAVQLIREWISSMPGGCGGTTQDAGPPADAGRGPDAAAGDAASPDASGSDAAALDGSIADGSSEGG